MSNSETTIIGTFEILRVGEQSAAQEAADQLRAMLEPRLGFTWSDIFVSEQEAAVVHCAQWPASGSGSAAGLPPEASQPAELARRLTAEAHGRSVRALTGTLAVSIDGAAASETPGVAVLAVRHVNGVDAAQELGRLLLSSGEWKRELAGFIGASAYISADGSEFINYVRWVDEAAYRRYMDDPRNAAGQPDIASVESAKPEFVRGQGISHVSARSQ